MNRRDLLIIFGVLMWGLYLWLVLPSISSIVSAEIIANFTVSIVVLLLYMGIIVITSIAIPKFGEWGDKKLWKDY